MSAGGRRDDDEERGRPMGAEGAEGGESAESAEDVAGGKPGGPDPAPGSAPMSDAETASGRVPVSVPGPVERSSGPGAPTTPPGDPLPDLLRLDLAELRTVEHPVLREVLAELRERAARPSEMLWGFNNSL